MSAPINPVPVEAIDSILDSVHDWLMADGHDYQSCYEASEAGTFTGCDVCEGEDREGDSDSLLTGARWLLERVADDLTPYSFRHNPDEEVQP